MIKLIELHNKDVINGNDKRICGLDLIRVCAIFFVIAGHFFSINTPYTESFINDVSMVIQSMLLTVLGVGVPLFMMLTGYLNINRTPTKKYYKGMIRVLVAYIIFSIATIAFRKFYLGENSSLLQWILKIFNYSAIPYAWYIEMWIGLALLTPFLNYLWKAIPTIQHKLLLIGTLFIITALPDIINRHIKILPDYFATAGYPIMFYYIGSFIREYKPTIKSWLGWIIMLIISLINPIITLLLYNGESISVEVAGGPGGALRACIAVTIFLMLYRMDLVNPYLKRWVTHCSTVSLEMYLCCYRTEKYICCKTCKRTGKQRCDGLYHHCCGNSCRKCTTSVYFSIQRLRNGRIFQRTGKRCSYNL